MRGRVQVSSLKALIPQQKDLRVWHRQTDNGGHARRPLGRGRCCKEADKAAKVADRRQKVQLVQTGERATGSQQEEVGVGGKDTEPRKCSLVLTNKADGHNLKASKNKAWEPTQELTAPVPNAVKGKPVHHNGRAHRQWERSSPLPGREPGD